jgi:hypothetical protein
MYPYSITSRRREDLKTLKLKMDSIDRMVDPIGYQKAYIAYNTLLHGPRWLENQKARISRVEIAPILKKYTTEFKELKKKHDEYNSQKHLNLLRDEISNSTNVMNRLASTSQHSTSDNSSIIFDGIVAVMSIVLVFKIYTKIKGSSPQSSPVL